MVPDTNDLLLKGSRSRQEHLNGLNMSAWKELNTFIVNHITKHINTDCFLPLSSDFETKNYISHLSELVATSSGKIV